MLNLLRLIDAIVMKYFAMGRKCLKPKWDALYYFDAPPLLPQYATSVFQMTLNMHLAHEAAQVAHNIV